MRGEVKGRWAPKVSLVFLEALDLQVKMVRMVTQVQLVLSDFVVPLVRKVHVASVVLLAPQAQLDQLVCVDKRDLRVLRANPVVLGFVEILVLRERRAILDLKLVAVGRVLLVLMERMGKMDQQVRLVLVVTLVCKEFVVWLVHQVRKALKEKKVKRGAQETVAQKESKALVEYQDNSERGAQGVVVKPAHKAHKVLRARKETKALQDPGLEVPRDQWAGKARLELLVFLVPKVMLVPLVLKASLENLEHRVIVESQVTWVVRGCVAHKVILESKDNKEIKAALVHMVK